MAQTQSIEESTWCVRWASHIKVPIDIATHVLIIFNESLRGQGENPAIPSSANGHPQRSLDKYIRSSPLLSVPGAGREEACRAGSAFLRLPPSGETKLEPAAQRWGGGQ